MDIIAIPIPIIIPVAIQIQIPQNPQNILEKKHPLLLYAPLGMPRRERRGEVLDVMVHEKSFMIVSEDKGRGEDGMGSGG